jgi:MFS family permease
VLTAALAAFGGWAVLRFLPAGGAPPDKPMDTPPAIQPMRLALDPRVSAHLVFGLGLSAVTAVLAQTFGFFLIDRLGLSPREAIEPTAAGFMVGALAVLAAQTAVLPKLKLAPRGLMMLGSGLIAIGLLIQILAPNLGAILFSQLIQGLGFGLARPGFTGGASLAVRGDEQGAIAGLIVGVSGAGFVVSPVLGGWLYDAAGAMTPYWLCFAAAGAMGVFAWRSRRLRAGEGGAGPAGPVDV